MNCDIPHCEEKYVYKCLRCNKYLCIDCLTFNLKITKKYNIFNRNKHIGWNYNISCPLCRESIRISKFKRLVKKSRNKNIKGTYMSKNGNKNVTIKLRKKYKWFEKLEVIIHIVDIDELFNNNSLVSFNV